MRLIAGLSVAIALAALPVLAAMTGALDSRSDQEKVEDALLNLPFEVKLQPMKPPQEVEGLVKGTAYFPGSRKGDEFVVIIGGTLEPAQLLNYVKKPRPGLYYNDIALQIRWQGVGDLGMRNGVEDEICLALSGERCPI